MLRSALAVLSVVAAAVLVAAALYLREAGSEGSPDQTAPADAAPREKLSLSEEYRKLIWEIENRAFQISHKTFAQIKKALRERDRAALLHPLAGAFEGKAHPISADKKIDLGFASLLIRRGRDQPLTSMTAEQWADQLLDYANLFEGEPRIWLKLFHFHPLDNANLEGGWEGSTVLRISGALVGGGLGDVIIRSRFGADQLPEGFGETGDWISYWELSDVVDARSDGLLMEDITSQTGINVGGLRDNWKMSRASFQVTSGGVWACDYNQDEITDLLVTDSGHSTLYQGLGGAKFLDVTIEVGLPWKNEAWMAMATAFADLDNDGDEDLILGDMLFENRDAVFLKRGSIALERDVVGVSIADYDGDALVDVYAVKQAPPHKLMKDPSWVDDRTGLPNQMWRNLGDFRFENTTEASGVAAGNRSSFTSVWLDADNDGWPDLYVIDELGSNILLRNDRNGSFSEQRIGPSHDGFTMGVAAGDVDGNGEIDLYLGNMFSKAGNRIVSNLPTDAYPAAIIGAMRSWVAGNLLLSNQGSGRFEQVHQDAIAQVGWVYGTGLVDLNADGLLDLFSTAGFASFSRDEPDG